LLRYALKRLLGAIPTLLLVIVLAFLMVHAAPGGPFDDERVLPPETREALEAAYNLDQPLHRQFIDYLAGVVTGDLGPSYHYRDHSVGELIGNAFPVSLQLGAMHSPAAQTCEAQSAKVLHFFSGGQGSHTPAQSMSVSAPF
jgi:oligopeptide transport system permease protein